MTMTVPGYEKLANVFQHAYDQAARTKGADRHANGLPFHEQPMQTVAQHHGLGFLLGQAEKKSIEAHGMAKRGEIDHASHELLGAINYLAGAIIHLQAQKPVTETAAPTEETASYKPKAPAEASKDDENCDCLTCIIRREIDAESATITVTSDDDDKSNISFTALRAVLKMAN